ncbi:PREDICTED: uncharacterized protein LOC107335265 [Acropora digitifera]|uniref:uncharacterized protein LOC107335265 n=1 Tax=Acropora digitifera TaxID=70779 RepID=UPI00077AEBF5|nr:PREDICTED: uncharacterized protein LOC107335265 [Acropora digitifera]
MSMRVEFYGCPIAPLCNYPLGMESGKIPAARITSSSAYNARYTAPNGRLHGAFCWIARYNNRNQWFKVDFGQSTTIRKIVTQGRKDANQWVKQYRLSYSLDTLHWAVYRQRSQDKYFTANRDRVSLVDNILSPPIQTRHLRIQPWGWYGYIAMRVEFFGCRSAVGLGADLICWYNNARQWLNIDLGTISRVKRIATQGRYDGDNWVTSYTVGYSMDNIRFIPYKEGRKIKVFPGNFERNFIVVHRFLRPFKARYVRVYPKTWRSHIAMRVELFGCRLGKLCNRPLGMQSGGIRNTAITSSSRWDNKHGPYLARLHNKRKGSYMGSWTARMQNAYQWLQIDLKKSHKVVRISTQGSSSDNRWVTSYYLLYSQYGVYFAYYYQRNVKRVFQANRDRNTIVSHPLIPPIRGRIVRIHMRSWYRYISMRLELYGCVIGRCHIPIGLEDGRIPSGALSASTSYNWKHGPDRARLNQVAGNGRTGGWVSQRNDARQWLQVDFGVLGRIYGLATQGRQDSHQWVITYVVSYSLNGRAFVSYKQYGRTRLFRGNFDRHTVAAYRFVPPFKAQFVRIHPKSWRSRIAMRVEFYGCLATRPCASPVGLQSKTVRNTAITASSWKNRFSGPYLARLHLTRNGRYMGAWMTTIRNSNQWLQVALGRPMTITGIATQGNPDTNQWVRQYVVAFSQDKMHFEYYMQFGNIKYFPANNDRYSVKDHSFSPPIKCSYFRVIPKSWYSYISLRLELYGCPENRCNMPLGLADRRIPNPLITASSYHSFYCGPWNARLHQRRVSRLGGSWCARTNNQKQYLQVDFEALARLTSVATQGRHDADQWVKSYRITFSKDGSNYIYYKERGVVKLYRGNFDRFIVVTHTFNRPITARYIRLHPVAYYGWMSMRAEFYGCVIGPICNRPIGMENGKIRDTQISASSEADSNHAAKLGRLNQKPAGKRIGAWAAGIPNAYQFLQIDLRIPMKITSVSTQGRNDNTNQWVTRYTIEYSLDGAHFKTFWSHGNVYYFPGNTNRNGIVMHRLFPMPRARVLRFRPNRWHRWISMRVEVHGCPAGRCSLPLGMEDKRILDGALSASSYASIHLAPWRGRINSISSWSSRVNNARQWLQINFGNLARCTGIATQGRRDSHQWVTRYVLSYGKGVSFKAYREKRKIRMFLGNSDRNSVVFYTLLAPFTARYVRIHPKAWRSHISMRVELYGCQRELTRFCSYPFGIQNGRLKNTQITASSMANKYHAPYFGRLKQVRRGRNMGGWSARYNNHNQWIQFDLRRLLKLTMVSTQGRKLAKQWVTRYTISTSIDCAHFVPYKQRDRLKVRVNETALFLAKYMWVVRYSDINRSLPYRVDVTKCLLNAHQNKNRNRPNM